MTDLCAETGRLQVAASRLRDRARELRAREAALDDRWPTQVEGSLLGDHQHEARSVTAVLHEAYQRVDALVRDLDELAAFADEIASLAAGDRPSVAS